MISLIISSITDPKLNIEQHKLIKTGGKLRCSGRVGSSCSISDTHRVTLQVTNPVDF
jgi:hypothetical protein